MYQRFAMSASDAEHPEDDMAHDPVRGQEERGRDHDEGEHHHGRDGGLAPRRPGDLGDLGPDLLYELYGIRLGHQPSDASTASRGVAGGGAPLCAQRRDPNSSPWQEWRDSNPQPPVLETGALAS